MVTKPGFGLFFLEQFSPSLIKQKSVISIKGYSFFKLALSLVVIIL